MTTLFIVIALLMLILVYGKIRVFFMFRSQVNILHANSENISSNIYNAAQLKGLPIPVQRYFKYAIKEGQPYISTVKLKHTGLFKTSLKKHFISISGEQHFSCHVPQFIWKGTTSFFTAMDSYIAGKGSLKVLLLNIFTVADAHGSTLDEGELQRWLAESVWFPTNLLPSENVK